MHIAQAQRNSLTKRNNQASGPLIERLMSPYYKWKQKAKRHKL